MSDCRIFALLKLLSSDMNEAYEAHFFFSLRARVYVFVELTRYLTQKCDESFLHKHKTKKAASELIPRRIMNAGKFVTVLNINSKGLDSTQKQIFVEAERAQLCSQ